MLERLKCRAQLPMLGCRLQPVNDNNNSWASRGAIWIEMKYDSYDVGTCDSKQGPDAAVSELGGRLVGRLATLAVLGHLPSYPASRGEAASLTHSLSRPKAVLCLAAAAAAGAALSDPCEVSQMAFVLRAAPAEPGPTLLGEV